MKIRLTFLITAIILIAFSASCARAEITTVAPNTSQSVMESEINSLHEENNNLRSQINEIQNQLDDAKQLRYYPLSYSVYSVLQRLTLSGKSVDQFYGIIKSIGQRHSENTDFYVLSIDVITKNPNWDGPGSDGGKGFYLNPEENVTEYLGDPYMVFDGFYYAAMEDKPNDVLHGLCNAKFVGATCVFYSIDGEIVCAAPEEGP